MLREWFVHAACEKQKAGEDLVIATVLSKSGSAPCLAGAKMLVCTDGSTVGTIGGGVLEARVRRQAAHVFKNQSAETMECGLSGEDAASMQMICGGTVRLLLDHVPATADNVAVFRELRDALHTDEKSYLVVALDAEDSQAPSRLSLVLGERMIAGDFPYPDEWVGVLVESAARSDYAVEKTLDGTQFVVERCFVPSTLHVCGSGDVGQRVAELAETVDFQTVIIDDHPELVSRERFPGAYALRVVDSFKNCFVGSDIDADSYIVIVTRGHLFDTVALTQALRTRAGYIGVLCGRTKWKQIVETLRQEGFGDEQIARVHSPIGHPIQASTPGEIAVSIVAELIETRAQSCG